VTNNLWIDIKDCSYRCR